MTGFKKLSSVHNWFETNFPSFRVTKIEDVGQHWKVTLLSTRNDYEAAFVEWDAFDPEEQDTHIGYLVSFELLENSNPRYYRYVLMVRKAYRGSQKTIIDPEVPAHIKSRYEER